MPTPKLLYTVKACKWKVNDENCNVKPVVLARPTTALRINGKSIVRLLAEQLVLMGFEVTLFASGDSLTSGELVWVCERPYLEDPSIDPKVWECLHIAELFKRADEYDLIHNHNDFFTSSLRLIRYSLSWA